MRFDPSKLEIVPLDDSNLARVIQIAETLEEAPRWTLGSYNELVSKKPSVPRIALVAQDTHTGEVAGFVIARPIPPEAELENIGVAVGYQRQGIGQRLMRVLAGELGRTGIEKLYLEVRASNASAQAFYRSIGFVQTGLRPSYYVDAVEDAVLMELRDR
jgi:ribosomal-protein-alanine N-acetyltransferase